MTSRLSQRLREFRKSGRKAFGAYVMAGDPDLKTTEEIVLALDQSGVTFVELGLPFSDPMADGPVIQKAAERALAKGATTEKILALVSRLRKTSDIPILLMGYYNPMLQYGLEKFARDVKAAGADAILAVDLPPGEAEPFRRELKNQDLDNVYLVTPTSTPDRVKLVERYGSGFAYYVSLTGVTGAKTLDAADVKKNLERIQKKLSLPIMVGFGISTPQDVKKLAPLADGVIVGSAIIRAIHEAPPQKASHRAVQLVQNLTKAL